MLNFINFQIFHAFILSKLILFDLGYYPVPDKVILYIFSNLKKHKITKIKYKF